tara:strand:+ start:214 stop:429 length:216 start_codon:yes stop_codon:yes gene_type:complete
MIHENDTSAGALSTKEKEKLLMDSFGALRSEIHSLAKQISFIKTLERNILIILMFCVLAGGGIFLFLTNLV